MRSRSRSSHPSTRLDSNARPTTGASVRAELEQTPRPPPRLRPSTEHTTTRPTERAIDRSIDRSTRIPRVATRRRIGPFSLTRAPIHSAAAAKTILRKTAATPRRAFMHRRLAHALVCILVGFRNPAPRVPSRHRASTRERFTNRIDPSRVRHQSSRATDGRGCSAPRWGHTHTHTHTHDGV